MLREETFKLSYFESFSRSAIRRNLPDIKNDSCNIYNFKIHFSTKLFLSHTETQLELHFISLTWD